MRSFKQMLNLLIVEIVDSDAADNAVPTLSIESSLSEILPFESRMWNFAAE